MRKLISLLLLVLFSGTTSAQAIPGQTIAIVNLRSGPGTSFDVVAVLEDETTLNFLGRNASATWLLVEVEGQQGWLSYTFVNVEGDVRDLPVADGNDLSPTLDEPETVQERPMPEDAISGSTTTLLNLRSGPGTNFEVVKILPANANVQFVGRNRSGTWLLAQVDGQQGWLSYTYVQLVGSVDTLPVRGDTQNTAPPPDDNEDEDAPRTDAASGIVPSISDTARQIFQRGQALGNNPDVFAKVGDSITASDQFLDPIGMGGLQLHGYAYLQDVVNYFSQTPARDHFSFANTSLAARSGWRAADVLNPARATAGLCLRDEAPLECEYRVNRPAVALIMLGTNDAGLTPSDAYEANMRRIVEITIERGIIPVLSTLPDQPNTRNAGRVLEFNDIIRGIAAEYDIPLWDYWQALQGLPNQGLSSDNVHPSYDFATSATAIFTPDALRYGYNVRNLTALMVLDAVWREAMN